MRRSADARALSVARVSWWLPFDHTERNRAPMTVTASEYESDLFAPPMAWRDESACLTEDPELFFPIGNHIPAQVQTIEAKEVCRTCPVRRECLAWALMVGEEHGIWGGLDENERRELRRTRAGRDRVLVAA